MKQAIALLAGMLALGSCASDGTEGASPVADLFTPAPPQTAAEALKPYYDTIPRSALPRAPEGLPLPGEDTVIDRVLLASCNDEEMESPALARLAEEEADLFLMIGDNVYGDRDGRFYTNNDADLTELRESFAEFAERAEFQAVRARFPMMVAWDDHDYGANDAGREFPFKQFAERIHETFWGLEDEDLGAWPGTYYERSFGPEGQRVQVIMLDTRFFRSELTKTDDYGAEGRERYLPAPDGSMQDMLGQPQWTWLENQLQKPADVRLLVSSIQVMPTVHGWEAWDKLPAERQRLFDLIESTDAGGVVFLTGDRHTGFIYEAQGLLPYEANELTASSLNVSFATETSEIDDTQVGAGYPPENYGVVEIDWEARELNLILKGLDGTAVLQNAVDFAAIGVE